MKELSLHILDIAMNSIKAGCGFLQIALTQEKQLLRIVITDDGCGMDEQTLQRLSDPFFTTRTTRKVGMGIPLYMLAAQQTGGFVELASRPGEGTTVTAEFDTGSIDCAPLGDVVSTVTTLIQGHPEIELLFTHRTAEKMISLDTRQLRAQLGEIPLNSFEVLDWIKEYLTEQYLKE